MQWKKYGRRSRKGLTGSLYSIGKDYVANAGGKVAYVIGGRAAEVMAGVFIDGKGLGGAVHAA